MSKRYIYFHIMLLFQDINLLLVIFQHLMYCFKYPFLEWTLDTYSHLLQAQPSTVLVDLCRGPEVPGITDVEK